MVDKPYPAFTPRCSSALARLRGVVDRIWLLNRHALAELHDALEWRRRKRVGRAAKHAMMELDDRLLLDIGLQRSEIHAAAYGLLPKDSVAGNPHDDATKQRLKRPQASNFHH
jgi:uncharacterized protein YjiS (DUF1127 family)